MVKELEGKSPDDTKGYAGDVLIAYDLMKEHLDRSLKAFSSPWYDAGTQEFLPDFL